MRRAARILRGLTVAVVVLGGIGYLARIGYREVTVEMALWQAKHFVAEQSAKPSRTDPKPLEKLRPRPWSSPLNNRHFDEAIAGARAASDSGDYDRAIALNTEALAIHPSPDLVWLLLTRRGNCYLGKNEPDKALADYEEAARLGGLDSRNYINRAFALRLKGKRDEGMKDFEAAIAANPNEPFAFMNRAAALVEDGELDKALADYEKALELEPRNIPARLGCAEIYLRRKEGQKAVMQSTIALTISANSASAYVARAKAFAQLGMNSRASADLDAVAKLKSVDRSAALNTVAWCRATSPYGILRDGRKAVAEATEACELDRWKQWRSMDTLAAACAEMGDFERAIKYQEQALQMTPAYDKNMEEEKQRLHSYQDHAPYREKTRP